jgi:hypothetical protein
MATDIGLATRTVESPGFVNSSLIGFSPLLDAHGRALSSFAGS